MDVEQAWRADLEDLEEDIEFWEDDELTPEELTCWQDAMHAAEQADRARGCPGSAAPGPAGDWAEASCADDPWQSASAPDGGGLRSEGSVPDLIAAAVGAAGDPAVMTDADLLQSLAGWHAVAARAAARELRATEELLRRRRPRVWDRRADRAESRREDLEGIEGEPGDCSPGEAVLASEAVAPERVMPAVVVSREAAAEVALALTATEYSAQAQVELAADLSRRLPAAFAGLDAGRADLHRVRVLAEGTRFLSDADAGKVDALLAPRLGRWTTGELKDKIGKAVIGIDPAAADRRAHHAARKARFAVYGNADQTATAAVERMPAHLGAAVKARVNAIARAAKAAGMTGPMPLLEAKVAAGLLLDTLPDIPPPRDGGPADPGDAGFTPSDPAGEMSWPPIPAQAGRDGPGCHGLPGWLQPKNPGRIRLTVPWRTLTGLGPEPGELSWTGPITPAQARDLAAAAAADPSCTWRVIITDDDGHAIAITTLRTSRTTGTSPPGLVSEVTITIQHTMAVGLGRDGLARDWITAALARLAGPVNFTGRAGHGQPDLAKLADLLAKAIPAANFAAAEAAVSAAADTAAGGCAHTMETPGYRVPDRLRRWLNTRDRTCRNPVCRQPALRCDQDHTLAYDRGGRTCTCSLGCLCRVHHQLKQLPGWQLTQDAQGYFTWRTPAGLTYRKEPYRYPV